MARQCSRGHDGTKPGEDVDDTSARHSTAPAHDIIKGKPGSSGEAWDHHGRNPRCGRRPSRGHGEAIGEISRTGRCTIVRSTGCAPSRWLTPAGVAGMEGAAAVASQSRELEREEEKGAQRLAGSGCDRATWSGSTKWAGTDRWASSRQVGQERV
jgi:hypothetical protein